MKIEPGPVIDELETIASRTEVSLKVEGAGIAAMRLVIDLLRLGVKAARDELAD